MLLLVLLPGQVFHKSVRANIYKNAILQSNLQYVHVFNLLLIPDA